MQHKQFLRLQLTAPILDFDNFTEERFICVLFSKNYQTSKSKNYQHFDI